MPNKPDLVEHAADLPATARAVAAVLATSPDLFERAGAVVHVVRPKDGQPIVKALTHHGVVIETHRHVQPVRFAVD